MDFFVLYFSLLFRLFINMADTSLTMKVQHSIRQHLGLGDLNKPGVISIKAGRERKAVREDRFTQDSVAAIIQVVENLHAIAAEVSMRSNKYQSFQALSGESRHCYFERGAGSGHIIPDDDSLVFDAAVNLNSSGLARFVVFIFVACQDF